MRALTIAAYLIAVPACFYAGTEIAKAMAPSIIATR